MRRFERTFRLTIPCCPLPASHTSFLADRHRRRLAGQQQVFAAWAQFHLAKEHEDNYEYGEQVARLTRATSLLNEAHRSCAKVAPEDLASSQEKALEQVSKAMRLAMNANNNVYMERVPQYDALPPPVAKSIVKPTPISELHLLAPSSSPPPEQGGSGSGSGADAHAASSPKSDDPFWRLVPISVLGEVSVYTARRDDLLRSLDEMREDAAQYVSGELASMDLPHALDAASDDATIPPPLSETLVDAGRTQTSIDAPT